MGIFDTARSYLEAELDRRIQQNTNGPVVMAEPLEKAIKDDGYGRKGLIFDPFQDQGYSGGLFRPKGAGSGFLSNFILKLVSRRDPIVSTILHIRSNQVATFCRKPSNRFDTGFKIKCEDMDQWDEEEVKEIEEYLLNTGSMENRSEEDRMSLNNFGYMIAHDMLTYGHCSIEMVRNRSGGLHSFLPLPAETIYHANKALLNEDQIDTMIETYRDVYQNMKQQDVIDRDTPVLDDYEFLQVINGKVVEGFTKEEMVFEKIYELSEIDLNGYAQSPLERAISMITAHLQIENHQKMFFTHGVASRGLLVIQGDVSPNQLRTLQAQWTNQVTQPQNAWRTPILAGIKGVQWEPLTIANRDMEYAAYQDHVIRTMHAVFAIDPEESGFGYLSKGVQQRALSESNNEWKVTASRDRGLRPVLARIESIVNDRILPEWRPEYAEKYEFCFVGLDAENRSEEIERLQAEVQLHTTLDEARDQADLDEMEVGGNLILNQLLLQTLQQNLYKGVFMEKFLGVQGASERPDLQYIPDGGSWFQWQQLQMQLMQQQSMAEAGMGPDGSSPPPSSGGGGSSEEKVSPEDQQQQDEMQAQQMAMAQAQASAVDKFISANPDLFKSMKENLKKSHPNTYEDKKVDALRNGLTKEFEKASEQLMRDIFAEVREDIKNRNEPVEKSEWKDKIPGGLADKKKPSDFDHKAISQGIKIELEHTNDRKIAEEIAMDHLTEDPKYYEKLKVVEGESESKKTDFISEESMGDFLTDETGNEVSPKKKKKKRAVKKKDS